MVRHLQTMSAWVIGLCAVVACSNASAEVSDTPPDQCNSVENGPTTKREPKKRGPKKRKPLNADRREESPPLIPAVSEAPVQPPSFPTPILPQIPQNALPQSSTKAPTVIVLPPQPKKFHGIVKRLCHPLKGKYFFLKARWKKGMSSDVVAYRVYVNGICEKVIRATKKACLQVLRHTRHVKKKYEIAAVDKNGNESGRTRLEVSYGKGHEPLCACRIAQCTTDLRQLTPEYLQTLSKERIIDLIQDLRSQVLLQE
jgi:hypothetical protein